MSDGIFGVCDVDNDTINIERPIFRLADAGLGADFAMNGRHRWVGIDAFGVPVTGGKSADCLARRAGDVEKTGGRIGTMSLPPELRR
jgi:hypothetical protein